ncbi:VWA domain-containing protein [Nitrospina gracilis]|uniref:VWA domain-containing protein n=1 Tax=Nitrospina gracilis TaxID=35801 RepID=UPI001F3BA8D1|nr:VWA domain-containing protein [Nitrospina gracilis]MCF8720482.1 Ca-activated chloride channel family protein [Nitrospina gracilis Nb-211]
MRFGQPEYLLLLMALALLIGFFMWSGKRKREQAARFASPSLLSRLVSPHVWEKQRKKATLIVLTTFFFILALAQPRWGYEWEDLKQEGVDIIVAVDVSQSMLATDIPPNRLERAKHEVTDLIDLLEGDRIGLVAFAGSSFLQCPLTLDYNAAKMFLNALGTDLIPTQGTAIGHAIRTAVNAFSQVEKKSKAILLITDGEDHEGDALAAAQYANEQGVKVFVIGIGAEEGAPIPDPERQRGFKRDQKGEIILTRLNEAVLQQVALSTGGSYVRSVLGDMDLNKIYLEDIKQRVEKKELRTTRRKRWQERFQWFVALGLVCLLGERLVREK